MRRRLVAFTAVVGLIAGGCTGAASPALPTPSPASTALAELVVGGDRPVTDQATRRLCGAVVDWRIEKFCLARRQRFHGQIYCLRCQAAIPQEG